MKLPGFASLSLLGRIAVALWRSGLLRLTACEILSIVGAWWRCRNSFAFLAQMAAIRFGSRPALRDDEGELSFGQLHGQSLALSQRLRQDFALGPGQQVALMGRNHRGFVLGLLACTRLGVDVLPLAPDLPSRVSETILKRQRISLLLHDPDLDCSAFGVTAVPLSPEPMEFQGELPPVRRGGELVVLTSGSSGIAKGIRRRPTLPQVLPLVAGLLESLPLQMHRPVVLAIPLYHGYGIATLAMALALGAPLQLGRRYEIGPLLQRLTPGDQPLLVTVPTLLSRWLKQGPQSQTRPAAVITGSAPLDAALCQQALTSLGPVLFNLYGSTEAGLVALATPGLLSRAPGSVGLPLPGNRVRLVDELDVDVPSGQVGRILVKGAFALPSRDDGWRDTGDLGRQDAEGNLYLCGRADTMIVSGGENVYPHEVEDLLSSHPLLTEVAVVVQDDEEFGRRMSAVVVPKAGANLDSDQIRLWLKERLERSKMPRTIRLLEEIPKNALGKVDRAALCRLCQEAE